MLKVRQAIILSSETVY